MHNLETPESSTAETTVPTFSESTQTANYSNTDDISSSEKEQKIAEYKLDLSSEISSATDTLQKYSEYHLWAALLQEPNEVAFAEYTKHYYGLKKLSLKHLSALWFYAHCSYETFVSESDVKRDVQPLQEKIRNLITAAKEFQQSYPECIRHFATSKELPSEIDLGFCRKFIKLIKDAVEVENELDELLLFACANVTCKDINDKKIHGMRPNFEHYSLYFVSDEYQNRYKTKIIFIEASFATRLTTETLVKFIEYVTNPWSIAALFQNPSQTVKLTEEELLKVMFKKESDSYYIHKITLPLLKAIPINSNLAIIFTPESIMRFAQISIKTAEGVLSSELLCQKLEENQIDSIRAFIYTVTQYEVLLKKIQELKEKILKFIDKLKLENLHSEEFKIFKNLIACHRKLKEEAKTFETKIILAAAHDRITYDQSVDASAILYWLYQTFEEKFNSLQEKILCDIKGKMQQIHFSSTGEINRRILSIADTQQQANEIAKILAVFRQIKFQVQAFQNVLNGYLRELTEGDSKSSSKLDEFLTKIEDIIQFVTEYTPEKAIAALNEIPVEMLALISAYLDEKDRLTARLVCKRFGIFYASSSQGVKKIPNFSQSPERRTRNISECFHIDGASDNPKVAISEDKEVYAIMTMRGIYIINGKDEKLYKSLPLHDDVAYMEVGPEKLYFVGENKYLITHQLFLESLNGTHYIRLWEVETKKLISEKKFETFMTHLFDLHPDGYCIGVRNVKYHAVLFTLNLFNGKETILEHKFPWVTQGSRFFYACNYSKVVLVTMTEVCIYDFKNRSCQIHSDAMLQDNLKYYFGCKASKNFLVLATTVHDKKGMMVSGVKLIDFNSLTESTISLAPYIRFPLNIITSPKHNLVCFAYSKTELTKQWSLFKSLIEIEIWDAKTCKQLTTISFPSDNDHPRNVTDVVLKENQLLIFTNKDIHTFTFPILERLNVDVNAVIQSAEHQNAELPTVKPQNEELQNTKSQDEQPDFTGSKTQCLIM